MLAIADRIAAINEQQLTAGNDQVVSLLLRLQTRLLVTLVAALVLRLGMAFFSTRRILGLEVQARLRYEEVADARGQLKDLSARHRPRKPSDAQSPANCTMRWGNLSRQ